jgi:hypothetical protein
VTEPVRVRLVDEPDRSGRSTATLLASLASRLMVLHGITGADAIGALTAGYAALGRRIARTAEGQRMLRAIRASRAGTNGTRLWDSLLIGDWASALPPTEVLDQLRNDLALLAADDLDEALELPPMPAEPQGVDRPDPDQPATAEHYLLGMWAFAREVIAGVEALAGPSLEPAGGVHRATAPAPVDGPLLQ